MQYQADLLELAREYGHRCYYCGRRVFVWVGPDDDRAPTREHLKPLSDGGTEIVLACRQCNRACGNLPALIKLAFGHLAKRRYGLALDWVTRIRKHHQRTQSQSSSSGGTPTSPA